MKGCGFELAWTGHFGPKKESDAITERKKKNY
jgi:hypothetical protein